MLSVTHNIMRVLVLNNCMDATVWMYGDRTFPVAGLHSPGLEQSATGGHISAITGHLSQASEDSSVHRVIFEHTTIVTD